jgi:hypothetical protein
VTVEDWAWDAKHVWRGLQDYDSDSLEGGRLWTLHFTVEEVHEESDVVTSGPWSNVALMHVDLATQIEKTESDQLQCSRVKS